MICTPDQFRNIVMFDGQETPGRIATTDRGYFTLILLRPCRRSHISIGSYPTQLVAGYFVGSVHFFRMYNAGKTIDVGDVWPETSQDLTAVEWAHALSSEAELKTALWGKSSFQQV